MLRPGLTRFILAFCVILYHLSQNIFLGYFAVGCFFILSGYWISLMYEHKYSKKEASLKVFYVSRLWRLLPVFYTFVILGLVVDGLSHSVFFTNYAALDNAGKSSIIFSNIAILGYAFNKVRLIGPAWSLDVELQFYIIFPLLAYLVRNNKKHLIFVTAAFFVFAVYVLLSHRAWLLNTSLAYLYLFFTGVLIYHYKLRPGPKIEKWSVALFISILVAQYSIPALAPYYRDGRSSYYGVLNFALIVTAIPTLINSVHRKTDANDKFLGEMSFMIYLSHWVWIIPYNMLITNASKFTRISYVSGFLIITLLSSYLVYRFIDRPSEKLRHKWVNLQK